MADYTIYNIVVFVDRVDSTGGAGECNRFRLFYIDKYICIYSIYIVKYIEHIWFVFCFWFFDFVFFFWSNQRRTVAQSVDGDVYIGWLKSLAWRRMAFCAFIYEYIYYTDIVRNTGGHMVIEIRAGTLKKSGVAFLYL